MIKNRSGRRSLDSDADSSVGFHGGIEFEQRDMIPRIVDLDSSPARVGYDPALGFCVLLKVGRADKVLFANGLSRVGFSALGGVLDR